MDAIQYARQQVKHNERVFDVYRDEGERSYGSDLTEVGQAALWVFDASATSSVVTEGTDEETSLTGLMRPSQDANDTVSVADELRLSTSSEKRYLVRTKVGVPSDPDPTLWRLGIDRANDSA